LAGAGGKKVELSTIDLIDTYVSDQWRISGGARSRQLREELRDRLIPIVIKAFGSVDFSLDLLLKESPCSNWNGITGLVRAYDLYWLRVKREAVEAGDHAAEQICADFQSQFHELYEWECAKLSNATGSGQEIGAILRTSYCRLPAAVIQCPVTEPFQENCDKRILGENPFPPGHQAYEVFEQAAWEARSAINGLRSELLEAVTKPPFDFIQQILTFRVRAFDVAAQAAVAIVGNEASAEWYERWLEVSAKHLLDDTLRKGQVRDPQEPETPAPFTPELLPRITADLHLQLMRVVTHYKQQAAERVLLVIEMRGKTPSAVAGKIELTAESGGVSQSGLTGESRVSTRSEAPEGEKSITSGEITLADSGMTSPWMETFLDVNKPKFMYHAIKPPVQVFSRQDIEALGPEWSESYVHQEYPKCKYHWTGKTVTVKSRDEELALGGGWATAPGAFDGYKDPNRARPKDPDPVKWIQQFPLTQGLPECRRRITAEVLGSHGAFWKAPDYPSATAECMRRAFERIAQVLFDEGLLTEMTLESDLVDLVWDSAIAGGWWHLASENPQQIFPHKRGHYWVWLDESRDWPNLFRGETFEWKARLLEAGAKDSGRMTPEATPQSGEPKTAIEPREAPRLRNDNGGAGAKAARAATVARLLKELNTLKPQMFEDKAEYSRLHGQYPDFLVFTIAETRPDLRTKILAIQGSTRHVRLAQELAAAHHGKSFATIHDDWKDHKPAEFRQPK
jgi:hypothetical protein